MRRFLWIIVFAFLPLSATAQLRDALLTPGGHLYAIDIEGAEQHPDVVTESSHYLVLVEHDGEGSTREIVPATLTRGDHSDPAIAYDAESGLLLVFWLRRFGLLYNEVLLVTRDSSGVWGEPTVVAGSWNYRKNLRVAVTRKVIDEETGTSFAGITAHAAWWELNSSTGQHSARYSMLSIENGAIIDMSELDLGSFLEAPPDSAAEGIPDDVLNQPLLQTSPLRDSVLVIFGDYATRSLHELRVQPTRPRADVRIRIPVGRRERDLAAPRLNAATGSRIDAVYEDGGDLAIYVRAAEQLDYVVLENGAWSDARRIVLDSDVTSDVALAAIRRLISGH